MTIDRVLIICTLIELTFISICDGPDCFTYFQWAAIGLLIIKGFLVLAEYRRAALDAVTQGVDREACNSLVDTDIVD